MMIFPRRREDKPPTRPAQEESKTNAQDTPANQAQGAPATKAEKSSTTRGHKGDCSAGCATHYPHDIEKGMLWKVSRSDSMTRRHELVVPAAAIANNNKPAASGHQPVATKDGEAAATEDKSAISTSDNVTSSPIPPTVSFPITTRSCICLDCRTDLYAQTTHFRELHRYRRGEYILGFFQHDAALLVDLALPTFDGLTGPGGMKIIDPDQPRSHLLSVPQRRAIQAFKYWYMNKKAHVLRLKWSPQSLVDQAIECFNQLFFLGELPDHTSDEIARKSLKVERTSPPSHRCRGETHTVVRGKKRQLVETTMWLDLEHPAQFFNGHELLNTILHEMCHAFLQRHSCYNGGGDGCRGNQVCVELCQENYGATGHGRAWQTLAAAVEEAAGRLLTDHVIGWKPDLGRLEAAVKEITTVGAGLQRGLGRNKAGIEEPPEIAGGWWPSVCDFENFAGEDWWKLPALMRSRDDIFVTTRKVRSWVLGQQGCMHKEMLAGQACVKKRWPHKATMQKGQYPAFDANKVGHAKMI